MLNLLSGQGRLKQIGKTAKMQTMREAQGIRGRNLVTTYDAEQYCGFQEKLWMYLAPLMLITRQVTQPCASKIIGSCLEPLDCILLPSTQVSKLTVPC